MRKDQMMTTMSKICLYTLMLLIIQCPIVKATSVGSLMRELNVLLSVTTLYSVIYISMAIYAAYKVITKKQKDPNKSWLASLMGEFISNKDTYFAVALHIADQASDYQAVVEYYDAWQDSSNINKKKNINDENVDIQWWFILSLCILLIHRVVSTAAIYLSTRSWLNTFLQLFDLAMVRAVFEGHKAQRREPGNIQRHLQSMEAIFESFPQLVLSMVYLLRTRSFPAAIVVQIFFSLFTLSLRVCGVDKEFFPPSFRAPMFKCKMVNQDGWIFPFMNFFWFARIFLFRLPEIVQRASVLSLFWSVIGGEWVTLLIFVDFILCKLASKYYATPTLKWKPLSLAFYYYILHFKSGVDSYEVWLVIRPLLASLYMTIIIIVSLIPGIGAGHNRDHSPPNGFELSLIILSYLSCLCPWGFRYICNHSVLQSNRASVNDQHLSCRDMLTQVQTKRDLKTVIRTRRWDVLEEMVRFGADPNHVMSLLLDRKETVIMLMEGCESMEEFICRKRDDRCCPDVCYHYQTSIMMPREYQYFVDRDDAELLRYIAQLIRFLNRRGSMPVMNSNVISEDDHQIAMEAIGEGTIYLIYKSRYRRGLPLNNNRQLHMNINNNGEWDLLWDYLIDHLDMDSLVCKHSQHFHKYVVLTDYAVRNDDALSQFSKQLCSSSSEPLTPGVNLQQFYIKGMDRMQWLKILYIFRLQLNSADHIEISNDVWCDVLNEFSLTQWLSVIESGLFHWMETKHCTELLNRVMTAIDDQHEKEQGKGKAAGQLSSSSIPHSPYAMDSDDDDEGESSSSSSSDYILSKGDTKFLFGNQDEIVDISTSIVTLIAATEYEFGLPFTSEKHLNGKWSNVFDAIIERLDWNAMVRKIGVEGLLNYDVLFDHIIQPYSSLRLARDLSTALKSLKLSKIMPNKDERKLSKKIWLQTLFIILCQTDLELEKDTTKWTSIIFAIDNDEWMSIMHTLIEHMDFPPYLMCCLWMKVVNCLEIKSDNLIQFDQEYSESLAEMFCILAKKSDFTVEPEILIYNPTNVDDMDDKGQWKWHNLIKNVIKYLDLDSLVRSYPLRIVNYAMLFDYSVDGLVFFKFADVLAVYVSEMDLRLFYPKSDDDSGFIEEKELMDRMVWIRLFFVTLCEMSLMSEENWAHILAEVPQDGWESLLQSQRFTEEFPFKMVSATFKCFMRCVDPNQSSGSSSSSLARSKSSSGRIIDQKNMARIYVNLIKSSKYEMELPVSEDVVLISDEWDTLMDEMIELFDFDELVSSKEIYKDNIQDYLYRYSILINYAVKGMTQVMIQRDFIPLSFGNVFYPINKSSNHNIQRKTWLKVMFIHMCFKFRYLNDEDWVPIIDSIPIETWCQIIRDCIYPDNFGLQSDIGAILSKSQILPFEVFCRFSDQHTEIDENVGSFTIKLKLSEKLTLSMGERLMELCNSLKKFLFDAIPISDVLMIQIDTSVNYQCAYFRLFSHFANKYFVSSGVPPGTFFAQFSSILSSLHTDQLDMFFTSLSTKAAAKLLNQPELWMLKWCTTDSSSVMAADTKRGARMMKEDILSDLPMIAKKKGSSKRESRILEDPLILANFLEPQYEARGAAAVAPSAAGIGHSSPLSLKKMINTEDLHLIWPLASIAKRKAIFYSLFAVYRCGPSAEYDYVLDRLTTLDWKRLFMSALLSWKTPVLCLKRILTIKVRRLVQSGDMDSAVDLVRRIVERENWMSTFKVSPSEAESLIAPWLDSVEMAQDREAVLKSLNVWRQE